MPILPTSETGWGAFRWPSVHEKLTSRAWGGSPGKSQKKCGDITANLYLVII